MAWTQLSTNNLTWNKLDFLENNITYHTLHLLMRNYDL